MSAISARKEIDVPDVDQDQIDFDAGFKSGLKQPEAVIPETDNDDTVEPSASSSPSEDVQAAAEPADETDWRAKFDDLEQKTKSWNGRLSAEAKAKADLAEHNARLSRELSELKAKLEPKPTIELDPEFEESWPDVASAIKAQEAKRSEYFEAKLAQASEQIRNEVLGQIAPFREASEQNNIESHFKKILDKHSDLETIVKSNKLDAWVDKHPRYIADSMRQVMEHGRAEDVIDMLDRFKADEKAVIEKQKLTRETKLNDAMAVRSRPGEPKQATTPDPNDFNAGWLLAKNSRR